MKSGSWAAEFRLGILFGLEFVTVPKFTASVSEVLLKSYGDGVVSL
jgi:hypothetical protein